jgi:hypothetical protein
MQPREKANRPRPAVPPAFVRWESERQALQDFCLKFACSPRKIVIHPDGHFRLIGKKGMVAAGKSHGWLLTFDSESSADFVLRTFSRDVKPAGQPNAVWLLRAPEFFLSRDSIRGHLGIGHAYRCSAKTLDKMAEARAQRIKSAKAYIRTALTNDLSGSSVMRIAAGIKSRRVNVTVVNQGQPA